MDDLQNIEDYIHLIRGHRVMLDRDIAAFYGVEAKRLNEKVKRNPKRFAGEDFMFQLTQEEYDELRLRSQFATIKKGRGSHSKYLPHAFTLLGVSMLSSVLESDTAIEANRRIMRAFVMFHHLKTLPRLSSMKRVSSGDACCQRCVRCLYAKKKVQLITSCTILL